MLTKFDHPAVVVKKEMYGDALFTITFKPETKIEFLPGQYVSVVIEGKRPAPFSIASSTQDGGVELGIGVRGEVTAAIRDLEVGASVILRGPFGRFTLGDDKKICLIAGGVGVTPFVSMMRSLRDTKSDIDAVLVYSTKKKESILWHDELLAFTTPLRTIYTLTGEHASRPYLCGRITRELITSEIPDYAGRVFYLCGPDVFISAMVALLGELGIPEEGIKRESW
jgi:ferredoxin-NADP reductase